MIVKGSDIERLGSFQSWNDNNCVFAVIKGENYRLKISEIMKFDTDFNNLTFKVVKKRKHKYLEVE